MRNVVTSLLPPGRHLLIRIEPPMTENERPIVMTVIGVESVTISKVDSGVVIVANATDRFVPFAFFVGSAKFNPYLPRWLSDLIGKVVIAKLRGGD